MIQLTPLLQSLVAGFFVLFLAMGWVYGAVTGSIKGHRDVVRMMAQSMGDMAYYLVLAFVAAHFVAMFNWTNLGLIVAVNGADFLKSTNMPAPALLASIVVMTGHREPADRIGERQVGAAGACAGADADAAEHQPGDDDGGVPRRRWRDQYHLAADGVFPADPDLRAALGSEIRTGESLRRRCCPIRSGS